MKSSQLFKNTFLSVALLCGFSACTKQKFPSPSPNIPLVKNLNLDSLPGPAPSAFSSEANLVANYSSMMDLYNTGVSGTLTLPKDKDPGQFKVAYRYFIKPNAKTGVVILPGRTEPMLKYAEVIWDLWNQGFSIFLISHRGQGESDHLLSNPQIGHIDRYMKYPADVDNFMRTIVNPIRPKNLFLLAHSMGGGIAALYEGTYPGNFQGIILNAPMMEINTSPYPAWVANTITSTQCDTMGNNTSFAIGQGNYGDNPDFNTYAGNGVTHSKTRWTVTKANLFANNPSLKLGGVSNQWYCNWVEGTGLIRGDALAPYNLTPTVLFQAGGDQVVNPGGQGKYCSQAQNCSLIVVPGAGHEILQETDDLRNLEMSRIVKFINQYAQ